MASIFGHAVSVIGFGSVFPRAIMKPKVFLIGVVSSMLPDVDVIAWRFGVWGLDMLGHRGLTHSLFFALFWSLILLLVFHRSDKKKYLVLICYYFICTASHGIIDGLTTGGDGIAYFAPFTDYRTHLPWSIIKVSPLGIGAFFSNCGLQVIKSELVWIGIPSLILILIGRLRK